MADSLEAPRRPSYANSHPGRRLIRVIAALTAVLLLLAAVMAAAVKTETGTRLLLGAVMGLIPGLSGEVVSGTLADGVSLRNLRYHDAQRRVDIDEVDAHWNVNFSPLTFTVSSMHVRQLDVVLLAGDSKPPTVPQRAELPLVVDVRDVSIALLNLHRDESITRIEDIHLAGKSDRVHYELNLQRADTPWGTARADVRIDGSGPITLDANASVDGRVLEEPLQIKASITGGIEALAIQIHAKGQKLSAQAEVAATPFARLPFSRAIVTVAHLNPRQFFAAAPRADLAIDANLLPSVEANGALRVAGPVTLRNSIPGPLDRELLPITSARMEVMLGQRRQEVTQLQVALPDAARFAGGGAWENESGELKLQVHKLNLRKLYTPLQATSLDGPVIARMTGADQHIKLELSGQPMSIKITADAHITPREISLKTARLQSGAALLQLSGTLSRDNNARYEVKGSLADFDPARFIDSVAELPAASGAKKTTGRKAASAGSQNARQRLPPGIRINMDFSANGKLKPELDAQLRFAIRDSTYDRLPMTGQGTLAILGNRLLPSQADVAIAGNTVKLNGSFGRPGDVIIFSLDAPALDRLGIGAKGRLQAQGKVGGTKDHPKIDAQWEATGLAFRDYQLERAVGEAHFDGLWAAAPDAKVRLVLDASRVRGGPLALSRMQASVEGTYAQHQLSLQTDGQLRGQPLNLRLAANGGVKQPVAKDGQPAWVGTIEKLDNRGFPDFSLLSPTRIRANARSVEIDATRLRIEQATIVMQNLVWRPGFLQTAGQMRALNVGHVLALQKEFTGKAAPVSSTMVLNGDWNVTWSDRAQGFVQFARASGDVLMKTNGRDISLGVETLRIRADLQGNRIRLDGQFATARLGRMSTNGDIGLIQQDGQVMLGPQSPLSLRVQAGIERLENVASLAGPRVALKGRTDADLVVKGTLGKPDLSGTVVARNLALTLYDQGVRLDDGVARLVITNNAVELREVVFHGGDGTLRATGSVSLDSSNPAMTATIVADRLQLIADPSRQLTVSGKAFAANPDGQLKITGAFTVNKALFNLPDKAAPRLGSDVVVIGPGAKPPPERTAAREPNPKPGLLPPRVDIRLGLGDDFRFRGSGAALLLAGALNITSGPGQPPEAVGTVRVVNGVYEAFGAKLSIERGLITFNGPFDNPALNIVAMRREQDVSAGVQVTGNVRMPRIELVSEPNLPEEEKLSWLVFGRGTASGGAGSGQAEAALEAAGAGLLNTMGSSKLAGRLGLDRLSLGASRTGALAGQQVVTLGKEISNRLYVGYEQSIAGIGGVVKLTYELSRNWSVALLGGASTGLDVLYSNRFDNLGERRQRRERVTSPE